MINYETHEVHAWAIMTSEAKIVCYIDPSVPAFGKVCNDYKSKGFHVVKLFGEIEMAEETVTITRTELKEVLNDYAGGKFNFHRIAEKLGFKRGLP
jgi:NADH:ubiquinone oxidoreductase subunit F (NADH-binding)